MVFLVRDTLDCRKCLFLWPWSSEGRAQCSHGKDSLSSVLSWQAPQWGRGDAPRPLPSVAGTELCLWLWQMWLDIEVENYIKLPSCIMVIRCDKKPLYMNIYIYTDYRLCIRNVYIERAPATVEQFDLRQVHPPKASTREPQTTRPKAAFNRNSSSHRRSYEGLSPKSSKIQKMTTGDNGIVPIFIHNKRFFLSRTPCLLHQRV